MQTIIPCLTFNDQAEQAVRFYTSIFNDAKVLTVNYYPDGTPMPAGSVMSITFQLNGQDFMALNGGSHFKFSDGISLFVNAETQWEIDNFWERLSEGGEKGPCGWLKDKFGVSWQVAPSRLDALLRDDPEKAARVMKTMLTMNKIDIEALEHA